MKAIAKYPGKPFKIIEIENSLEALQKFVGGYIEAVTINPDVVVICNEEGRISDMRYNWTLAGVEFFGPILITGKDGEEFSDIPKHCHLCQRLHPECICNTCENDTYYLFLIKDEFKPCCDKKNHKKHCDTKECPDYIREGSAGSGTEEKEC